MAAEGLVDFAVGGEPPGPGAADEVLLLTAGDEVIPTAAPVGGADGDKEELSAAYRTWSFRLLRSSKLATKVLRSDVLVTDKSR